MSITIGLPQIHAEKGEKRDFLPEFAHYLSKNGASVIIEHGYGAGMGIPPEQYLTAGANIRFATLEEVYQQDIVLVLRYPGDDKVSKMRPGACLVSMLHYPTRPKRTQYLKSLGIEAISLDSIKDDLGKRLVENLRSVAWNGAEVAFNLLKDLYPPPGIEDPNRNPIKVTVMGSGAVGGFAIQAAVRYGNQEYWKKLATLGATGVQVTVVEYDLTNHEKVMMQILKYTDILIDATQRPDPRRPVIPNDWIDVMRPYAILLDLSVDPYDSDQNQILSVKGIEGIPHGNLDQYIFPPDDPSYNSIPPFIQTKYRRYAVSCYSWPGIHPEFCMNIYGQQLAPIFFTLLQIGGVEKINSNGTFFEKAISRAMLSNWIDVPF